MNERERVGDENAGDCGGLVYVHGHGLFPIREFRGSAFVTEACCERTRSSVKAGTLAIYHHANQTQPEEPLPKYCVILWGAQDVLHI